MKKSIVLTLIFSAFILSGCVLNSEPQPTGGAINISLDSQQAVSQSFENSLKNSRQFVNETKSAYTTNGTTYYFSATENFLNPKKTFLQYEFRYELSFKPAMEFSAKNVRINWFGTEATITSMNSDAITIKTAKGEETLKNFNKFKGNLNTEIVSLNGKLEKIVIYNASPATSEEVLNELK
ncbi:MAG: hypothetical protein ABIJ74_00610 [archaeon]